MTLFPVSKEVGGGGLSEFFSRGGGEMKWPESVNGQPMGYACHLINHGNIPIFNVSMSFGLIFREVVQDQQLGTLKSGKVTLARDYSIQVNRIDGSNGAFLFYVANHSPQFVQVTLPKSAVFQVPGIEQQQTTRIIQPRIIMNFLPMKAS